eukprot:5867663-Prymnesium_polylepis.1
MPHANRRARVRHWSWTVSAMRRPSLLLLTILGAAAHRTGRGEGQAAGRDECQPVLTGLPPLAARWVDNRDLYGLDRRLWRAEIADPARDLVRAAGERALDFDSSASAAHKVGNPLDELRRRGYSGVIFVGDSQVREAAWAATRMLASHGWIVSGHNRLKDELRRGGDCKHFRDGDALPPCLCNPLLRVG